MAANWQENFTATGGPMPYRKNSAWERAAPGGPQAPVLPPFRFTDETIIPVVVRIQDEYAQDGRKSKWVVKSYTQKLRDLDWYWRSCPRPHRKFIKRISRLAGNRSSDDTVVVHMPRSEYLKNFPHDEEGRYIGKPWSRKELDLEFGMYEDAGRRRWVRRVEDGRSYMEEESNWGLCLIFFVDCRVWLSGLISSA